MTMFVNTLKYVLLETTLNSNVQVTEDVVSVGVITSKCVSYHFHPKVSLF